MLHYAQDWVCGGGEKECYIEDKYKYDKETHSVESDLILDSTKRAVPYAVYYTDNEIIANPPGDLSLWNGYGAALGYYEDNIKEILRQIEQIDEVPIELSQTLCRGLFIDVFSILELFLSDVILCLIYSDDSCYDKALAYCNKCDTSQTDVLILENAIHYRFTEGIVYHQFDKVKCMFNRIVGIDIPNYDKLKVYLHKRNNIVHRYSLSNIDRIQVTIITKEDIKSLIEISNEFVDQLIEKIDACQNS